MDDDTRDYLRAQVAAEVGLPQGWGDRVRGDSISAMRDDAAQLAQALGVSEPSPRERGADGRFVGGAAWMNAELRRAAGRG